MILAMLRFWEELGGRIAVLSATLPDAFIELLDDSLHEPCHSVTVDEAWPQRDRLVMKSFVL